MQFRRGDLWRPQSLFPPRNCHAGLPNSHLTQRKKSKCCLSLQAPSEEQRSLFLSHMFDGVPTQKDVQPHKISTLTAGFSFTDLSHLQSSSGNATILNLISSSFFSFHLIDRIDEFYSEKKNLDRAHLLGIQLSFEDLEDSIGKIKGKTNTQVKVSCQQFDITSSQRK